MKGLELGFHTLNQKTSGPGLYFLLIDKLLEQKKQKTCMKDKIRFSFDYWRYCVSISRSERRRYKGAEGALTPHPHPRNVGSQKREQKDKNVETNNILLSAPPWIWKPNDASEM